MQTLAQDRESASRIARALIGGMVPTAEGVGFEVPVGPDRQLNVREPSGETPSEIYAAFSRDGGFIREVSAEEFHSGVNATEDPLHIVSIRLSSVDGSAFATGSIPLLDLVMTVEQPARAPETSRSRESFQTRLASP